MSNQQDKDRIEEKKQANVPDGDSRPDHQEDAWNAEQKARQKKKFTPERRADVNDLEDFRDAK